MLGMERVLETVSPSAGTRVGPSRACTQTAANTAGPFPTTVASRLRRGH